MSKLIKVVFGAVIAVATSLLLYQIEVGWYGIWANWLLLGTVVILSFTFGFWGIE